MRRAAVFLAAALAAAAAPAADRPFLLVNSAAAEEDDDNVWSIESAFVRIGPQRSFSLMPEYAFSPTDSLQLEMTRSLDRASGERLTGVELEAKHLFNHIERDGWGVGLVASLSAARMDGGSLRPDAFSLRVPWSLQLGESRALLHVNAGFEKPRDERRRWLFAAAAEVPVTTRVTAFAEAGHSGGERIVQGGARWWLRRERLALDFGVVRSRADSERRSGAVLAIGWYDL